MATAYTGLALLAATLLTGPINVFRGRRTPVPTDLRRDTGIWCGIMSLAHVVIGLQVHMGNMLLYFFREAGASKRLVPRSDLFGFANFTGLIATFIVALLLALSNDVSLRKLGSRRWKSLQQWNYGLLVLVMIHSIAYQIIENRQPPFNILLVVMMVVTFSVQAAGYWLRRRASMLEDRSVPA